MSEQVLTFDKAVKEHFSMLELYTDAIKIAHGDSHPEAIDVRKLFERMKEKVEKEGTENLNLTDEFEQLREVTNHYSIPKGVCVTFARTYDMLSKVDKAYHS